MRAFATRPLEALLVSTSIVALAEMGDKTQLLSFVLAAKLKRKVPILLGITAATQRIHFMLIRWASAPPIHTAGALAITMPRVVPATTAIRDS